MTPDLDLQLDRLRELIQRVGMEPLLRAPLVTPEDRWFPDRWTPDLESVRRLLLRLAEFAGMPELGVEVVSFTDNSTESTLPAGLEPAEPGSGIAGLFHGIDQGTAWFGVESSHLIASDRLVAVLAHEMTHAWRRSHGLEVENREVEERLTDLTTIVLGFGILTCNTSYQYESSGTVRGAYATTSWSHYRAGYLSVEDMSGLLACWAQLLDMDPKPLMRWLGPTQRELFERAWDELVELDLNERLALPAGRTGWTPMLTAASQREFPPGRSAAAIHTCVADIVKTVGEAAALLEEPVAFPVGRNAGRHRALALWGRVSLTERWSRELLLVSDPVWSTNAIVLVCVDAGVGSQLALGHADDKTCAKRGALKALLGPLFEPSSRSARVMLPGVPTVATQAAESPLGEDDFAALLQLAVARFDPAELALETEWVRRHLSSTATRMMLEREGGKPGDASEAPRADARQWWRWVSKGSHVDQEISWLGLVPEQPMQTGTAPGGSATSQG